MLVIERQIGGSPRKYDIYEPNEVCPYKAKYWKDIEVGNPNSMWAITDDDYKCEVISVKEYRVNKRSIKKNKFIKLSIGACFVRPGVKLEIGDYLNAGQGYASIKPDRWARRQTRRKVVKNTVMAYVQMMFGGKIDWNALGRIYRPGDYIPAATVKRLFRQKEIQDMVKNEIKDYLKSTGITEEWVLEKLKKAIEIAETNEDPNNMLKAIPFFEKYLDMEPQKVKQIESVEFDYKQIEDGIEEEASLKASRETIRPLTAGDIAERDLQGVEYSESDYVADIPSR